MKLTFNRAKPHELLISAMIFSLIFSVVFVGDFLAFGVFFFLPIFVLTLFFRYITGIQLKEVEILSFLALAIIYLSVMLANTSSISSYYFSLLFSALFIFCIPLVEWLLQRSELTSFSAALLLVMLPFALISLIQGDIRSSIIFGPNIYYRIIGFLYIMFLLVSLWTAKLRKYRLLVLVAAITILLSTGSRGAVPVIVLLIILYGKATLNYSRNGTLKLIFFLLIVSGGLLYYIEDIYERLWRFFYFSLDNASLQTRWFLIEEFIKYLETMSLKNFLFGDGESQRIFFFYPHNIFLESFVYHGVIVTIIFAVYFVMFIFALFQPFDARNRNLSLIFLFSPIFLGSLVSGSFFEAYTVAAVTIFVLARIGSKFSENI